MLYYNPIYGIFNQPYVENQLKSQHHNDQVCKSFDCARKLEDFFESMDKVEPEYQQLALTQCCFVIGKYMKKHSMI